MTREELIGRLKQDEDALVERKTKPEAVVFGLAHTANPPIPNWRYGLLAGLAGLAYGHVYQRARSISASALTHGGADG